MQKLSFSLVALVVLAITLTASALTTVSIDPVTVALPEVGQQLEIQVKISGGRSIAGYQLTLIYDQTALAYVNIKVGDYLPEEKHEFTPVDSPGLVTVWAVAAINDVARKTDGSIRESKHGSLAIDKRMDWRHFVLVHSNAAFSLVYHQVCV